MTIFRRSIIFPTVLLWISLTSVLFSNVNYHNHAQLVDGVSGSKMPLLAHLDVCFGSATGPSLPDPSTVLESTPFLRRLVRNFLSKLQKNPRLFRLISNPFTLAPASFSIALLYAAYIADVCVLDYISLPFVPDSSSL